VRWNAILQRIDRIENPIGCEIGVWRGEMSINLLSSKEDLFLIMVDPWDENVYDKDTENMSATMSFKNRNTGEWIKNFNHVVSILNKYENRYSINKLTSESASKLYNEEYFDFVFIDGDHSENGVMKDIELWLPKVKSNGYICGHDYKVFHGVTNAVNKSFKKEYIELDEDFTWFVRK
jgi:hypothetical protein